MTDSLPTSLQDSVAGSFHKTALLQKRVRELIKGASPLIDTREKNPIRVALMELQQGLIELMPDEEIHPILMNPVAGLGAVSPSTSAGAAAAAAAIANETAAKAAPEAVETKTSATDDELPLENPEPV